MSKPRIAVVDWKDHPRGDENLEIESQVLSNHANVTYHLVKDSSDYFDSSDNLREAEVVILWHNAPCDAECIAALNKCKVIIRNGVGYDTVDLDAAKVHNITVCNIPDYGTEEVANHAIALALTLTRQIVSLDHHAKKLNWELPSFIYPKIKRYSEMFFGIIGLGRIGMSVAEKAEALGFNVYYYDPFVNVNSFAKCETLNELLTLSDVLSIHCPLNDNTKYMITDQELDLLKNSAYLINTARGAIVKKSSILNALNNGRLAGAGLDVVEDEPLKTINESMTPNLICTCHSAFYSMESLIDMRTKSSMLALAAVTNKKLYNIVSE